MCAANEDGGRPRSRLRSPIALDGSNALKYAGRRVSREHLAQRHLPTSTKQSVQEDSAEEEEGEGEEDVDEEEDGDDVENEDESDEKLADCGDGGGDDDDGWEERRGRRSALRTRGANGEEDSSGSLFEHWSKLQAQVPTTMHFSVVLFSRRL